MGTPASRIVASDYLMLEEPLGAGGMGTVHLARGLSSLGRIVAIKRATGADAKALAHFAREARLAGRVSHPNVAATIDVVADGRDLLLVMEYVHGETLSRVLGEVLTRNERFPPRIAVGIAVGILRGLTALHRSVHEGKPAPILHRDVSPANVLLTEAGIPKLVDFGIAKTIDATQVTAVGEVKGKLAYMAPEQLESRASEATDIYAASVVLWEMLTLRRLFAVASGGPAALVPKIMYGHRDPPSRFATEISKELDAIVLRGLAPAEDERWSSAEEMASALEACVGVVASTEIASWVAPYLAAPLAERDALLAELRAIPAPDVAPIAVAPSEGRPFPRARTLAIGAVALVAVTTLVTIGFLRADASRSPPSSPAEPTSIAVVPSTTDSLPPASSSVEAVTPLDGDRAHAPRPPVVRRPPPSPASSAARPTGCDPPYTVDANGAKHFRAECFRVP